MHQGKKKKKPKQNKTNSLDRTRQLSQAQSSSVKLSDSVYVSLTILILNFYNYLVEKKNYGVAVNDAVAGWCRTNLTAVVFLHSECMHPLLSKHGKMIQSFLLANA